MIYKYANYRSVECSVTIIFHPVMAINLNKVMFAMDKCDFYSFIEVQLQIEYNIILIYIC